MTKYEAIRICKKTSDWYEIVKMSERPENENISEFLMELAFKKYCQIKF